MPRPETVYLAGPMTDIDYYNFPAFHLAASAWRECGFEVINPAEEFEGRTDLPRKVYMRRAVENVPKAQAIALLGGWRESPGALFEVSIGRRIGSVLWDAGFPHDPRAPKHESVCEEAQRLVYGARGATYGHPLKNFENTAALWSPVLGVTVSPEQVALCMAGIKIARLIESPGHRDGWADLAGYSRAELIGIA